MHPLISNWNFIMIRGSAHKSGTAGQVVDSDYKRGIVSDRAKTLGDVIDRVKKSEELDKRTKDYLEGNDAGVSSRL